MIGSCTFRRRPGCCLFRPSFASAVKVRSRATRSFRSKIVGSPLCLGSPQFLLIELLSSENALFLLMIALLFGLLAMPFGLLALPIGFIALPFSLTKLLEYLDVR